MSIRKESDHKVAIDLTGISGRVDSAWLVWLLALQTATVMAVRVRMPLSLAPQRMAFAQRSKGLGARPQALGIADPTIVDVTDEQASNAQACKEKPQQISETMATH
ncbi:hypothetical protein OAS86_05545 [Gammaproteobacteria bacterium]|nr:hypothetical protein [Gammaproteobacteria bacterium]